MKNKAEIIYNLVGYVVEDSFSLENALDVLYDAGLTKKDIISLGYEYLYEGDDNEELE